MTAITVSNLSFRYQNSGPNIIEDINFTPKPASFNLLAGSSGSGKSTLLKIMAGLYPQFGGTITSGQVLLNGQEIGPIVPFERAQRIALLFQNPDRQFAMSTAWEQLIFSLENLQLSPELITQRATDALQKFDLWELRNQSLQTLSGGEQQRVALANILALDSDIILLDEPFANVDPTGRQTILSQLKLLQIEHGKTIIISDHDLHDYIDLADAVFTLEQQHLTRQPLEILTDLPSDTLIWHAPNQLPESGQLTWHNLTIEIGSRRLLNQQSWQLPENKLGLLSGPNGIGKSTFFKALAHLQPYQGQITFAEQISEKIKLKNWTSKVAWVMQNARDQFITLTVSDELTISRRHSANPAYWTTMVIEQAIQDLNLTAVLEQSVYQLSGGQQKKLQTLSMLIMAPQVLLIDEPLAGLDYQSSQVLLSLIQRVVHDLNLSALMISHQRTGLQPYLDYELRLDHEQIVDLRGLSHES